VLAAQFETVFPELFKQKDFVEKVVLEEEQGFLRTLEGGLRRMDELMKESGETVDGGKAFELYDTFGFPLDLTMLIAQENNLKIDEAGFAAAMQHQKNRSRLATALETDDWMVLSEEKGDGFVGYNDLRVSAKVMRYRKVSGKGKTQFQVVLNHTPFYAESGGQVGDTGQLIFGEETIAVTDTKKDNDVIVHLVNALPASLSGECIAAVDAERRLYIMYNHTATHLMHAALREVLGNHVAQKGSLVNEDGLRFDFSHFTKMTDEEIRKVESIVNAKIRENILVVIRSMAKEDALQLGAMALFDEKYGDTVRVVTIDPHFSVELCGGTHVMHTGMIGLFALVAESAVAAGVRRIEALTGPAAFRYLSESLENLKEIGNILKAKDPVKAVDKLITENAQLKKHIESLEARQLVVVRNELLQKDEIINQVNFIADIIEVPNADALKKLCHDLKNHLNDFVVVLCANIDGKSFVAISIAETVVAAKGLDAGQMIKQVVAPLIKGGGGGQKTLATAGGQDISKLGEVIESIKKLL
jgi:alanyl-tRNA synthetase